MFIAYLHPGDFGSPIWIVLDLLLVGLVALIVIIALIAFIIFSVRVIRKPSQRRDKNPGA